MTKKILPLVLAGMVFFVILVFAGEPAPPPADWKKIYPYTGVMVWDPDSGAVFLARGYLGRGLATIGRGVYISTERDTIILEGSDTDTVRFNIPHACGFFTLWIMSDTANFAIKGVTHNHQLGASDSLTVRYQPGNSALGWTGNSPSVLSFIKELDWEAEKAYYESLAPPVASYLDFYITHTGEGDTSAVIIELKWQ